ncbi:MAG: MarR family winged helix-turn-helix transcriptional regulator [Gemmatimonadota bacterium]
MHAAFRQDPPQPHPAPAAVRAIADRLHSAAIHVLRRLRVEDKVMGLSAPRTSALSVIVFRGPITMSELAEAEQVKPPTITRLVEGLVRRGLVRRVSDASDGRVQRVEATAAGRGLLNRGRARRVARLAQGVAELTKDDQDVLARAAELMDNLAAMG